MHISRTSDSNGRGLVDSVTELGRRFSLADTHRQSASKATSRKTCAKRYARQIGKRAGVAAAILVVLAIVLIPVHESSGIKNAYNYRDITFDWETTPGDYLVPMNPDFSDYNVLIDGHSHTTLSDGKLTPEQLVEYSIAQGFNAIIVTDHNTVSGGLRAEKYAKDNHQGRFVVVPGMEYTSCRIHMNFININITVTEGNSAFPSDADIKRAIDRVHELGGLVIVNHIPWSNHTLDRLRKPRLPNHPSIQSLVAWGVDGFEVINQATFDMPTYQYVKTKLILMTGSDVHAPSRAYAWTVLKAQNLTKEAVMDEISHARTSFLFDPTGNSAGDIPKYTRHYLALAPLTGLSDYFDVFYDRYKGQYSFHGSFCQRDIVDIHATSIGCFVVYLAAVVVILELAYVFFGYIRLRVKQCQCSNNSYPDDDGNMRHGVPQGQTK
ncbi:Polymerase/histidinol phosphatase-like protein [Coemansia spiralis]|nr:Polymerase/histidinol phosphatase-like protein [Coemansia spiralis]